MVFQLASNNQIDSLAIAEVIMIKKMDWPVFELFSSLLKPLLSTSSVNYNILLLYSHGTKMIHNFFILFFYLVIAAAVLP